MTKVKLILFVCLVLQSFSILSAGKAKGAFTGLTNIAAEKLCDTIQFKKLYIKLQQDLNYEGRDAVIDSKGKISLSKKNHVGPYEGKVFEDALYAQYTNSLRKVGLMYKGYITPSEKDKIIGTNTELIGFFEAIKDPSRTFTSKELNNFMDKLQERSIQIHGKDSKEAISIHDVYLLKKLLLHTQDYICRVHNFEEGKISSTTTKEKLEKVAASPINMLLKQIREAKITEQSDIIIDDKKAINEAIKKDIDDLRNFLKNKRSNPLCKKYYENMQYLDNFNKVQECNFGRFINSLMVPDEKFNDLESILHFINANQSRKYKDQVDPLAETNLDHEKLEREIKLAFEYKIPKIDDDPTKKSDPKTECEKQSGKVWDAEKKECIDKPAEKPDPKTECEKQSGKVWDAEKKECIDKPAEKPDPKTECEKQSGKVWDAEKKECIDKPAEKPDPKTECEKQSGKVWDAEKKECIDKPAEKPSAEKECEEKNKKDSDENDGRPMSNWKVKDGKCVNTKEKKSDSSSDSTDEPPAPSFSDLLGGGQKSIPRFTPTQIPTRQPYMLMGMP